MIGVYSLFDKDVIVYVGKSKQVEERIKNHKYDGKIFDRYECVECLEEEMNELEISEIRRHKPKYNIDF